MSIGSDIIAPVLVALLLAGGAIFLRPVRNKLAARQLKMSGDHGIKVAVYPNADEMRALARKTMLGVDPFWVTDEDFYFANGVPPGVEPPHERKEWPGWARGQGGEVVGWQHIFVLIQATQDRAVVLRTPKVNSRVSPVTGGVVLSPAKQPGGNGLMVRQFAVDLDARPPTATFLPEGEPEVPSFTLKRNESVGFFLVVWATKDRHEWTLDLPMLVDGQAFNERISNHGQPFVSVGSYGVRGQWWDFERRIWREPDW